MKEKLNIAVIGDVVVVVRVAVDEYALMAVQIAALDHAQVHVRDTVKAHAKEAVQEWAIRQKSRM